MGPQEIEIKKEATRGNTKGMRCNALTPYAPHVGKKKEQNVLSNWLPINTKPSAEGKAPNF